MVGDDHEKFQLRLESPQILCGYTVYMFYGEASDLILQMRASISKSNQSKYIDIYFDEENQKFQIFVHEEGQIVTNFSTYLKSIIATSLLRLFCSDQHDELLKPQPGFEWTGGSVYFVEELDKLVFISDTGKVLIKEFTVPRFISNLYLNEVDFNFMLTIMRDSIGEEYHQSVKAIYEEYNQLSKDKKITVKNNFYNLVVLLLLLGIELTLLDSILLLSECTKWRVDGSSIDPYMIPKRLLDVLLTLSNSEIPSFDSLTTVYFTVGRDSIISGLEQYSREVVLVKFDKGFITLLDYQGIKRQLEPILKQLTSKYTFEHFHAVVSSLGLNNIDPQCKLIFEHIGNIICITLEFENSDPEIAVIGELTNKQFYIQECAYDENLAIIVKDIAKFLGIQLFDKKNPLPKWYEVPVKKLETIDKAKELNMFDLSSKEVREAYLQVFRRPEIDIDKAIPIEFLSDNEFALGMSPDKIFHVILKSGEVQVIKIMDSEFGNFDEQWIISQLYLLLGDSISLNYQDFALPYNPQRNLKEQILDLLDLLRKEETDVSDDTMKQCIYITKLMLQDSFRYYVMRTDGIISETAHGIEGLISTIQQYFSSDIAVWRSLLKKLVIKAQKNFFKGQIYTDFVFVIGRLFNNLSRLKPGDERVFLDSLMVDYGSMIKTYDQTSPFHMNPHFYANIIASDYGFLYRAHLTEISEILDGIVSSNIPNPNILKSLFTFIDPRTLEGYSLFLSTIQGLWGNKDSAIKFIQDLGAKLIPDLISYAQYCHKADDDQDFGRLSYHGELIIDQDIGISYKIILNWEGVISGVFWLLKNLSELDLPGFDLQYVIDQCIDPRYEPHSHSYPIYLHFLQYVYQNNLLESETVDQATINLVKQLSDILREHMRDEGWYEVSKTLPGHFAFLYDDVFLEKLNTLAYLPYTREASVYNDAVPLDLGMREIYVFPLLSNWQERDTHVQLISMFEGVSRQSTGSILASHANGNGIFGAQLSRALQGKHSAIYSARANSRRLINEARGWYTQLLELFDLDLYRANQIIDKEKVKEHFKTRLNLITSFWINQGFIAVDSKLGSAFSGRNRNYLIDDSMILNLMEHPLFAWMIRLDERNFTQVFNRYANENPLGFYLLMVWQLIEIAKHFSSKKLVVDITKFQSFEPNREFLAYILQLVKEISKPIPFQERVVEDYLKQVAWAYSDALRLISNKERGHYSDRHSRSMKLVKELFNDILEDGFFEENPITNWMIFANDVSVDQIIRCLLHHEIYNKNIWDLLGISDLYDNSEALQANYDEIKNREWKYVGTIKKGQSNFTLPIGRHVDQSSAQRNNFYTKPTSLVKELPVRQLTYLIEFFLDREVIIHPTHYTNFIEPSNLPVDITLRYYQDGSIGLTSRIVKSYNIDIEEYLKPRSKYSLPDMTPNQEPQQIPIKKTREEIFPLNFSPHKDSTDKQRAILEKLSQNFDTLSEICKTLPGTIATQTLFPLIDEAGQLLIEFLNTHYYDLGFYDRYDVSAGASNLEIWQAILDNPDCTFQCLTAAQFCRAYFDALGLPCYIEDSISCKVDEDGDIWTKVNHARVVVLDKFLIDGTPFVRNPESVEELRVFDEMPITESNGESKITKKAQWDGWNAQQLVSSATNFQRDKDSLTSRMGGISEMVPKLTQFDEVKFRSLLNEENLKIHLYQLIKLILKVNVGEVSKRISVNISGDHILELTKNILNLQKVSTDENINNTTIKYSKFIGIRSLHPETKRLLRKKQQSLLRYICDKLDGSENWVKKELIILANDAQTEGEFGIYLLCRFLLGDIDWLAKLVGHLQVNVNGFSITGLDTILNTLFEQDSLQAKLGNVFQGIEG